MAKLGSGTLGPASIEMFESANALRPHSLNSAKLTKEKSNLSSKSTEKSRDKSESYEEKSTRKPKLISRPQTQQGVALKAKNM